MKKLNLGYRSFDCICRNAKRTKKAAKIIDEIFEYVSRKITYSSDYTHPYISMCA